MRQRIDELGARLLTLLQEDSSPTMTHLAEMLGVNVSTIQRRLEALRRDGVVTHTVSLLDPDSVGRPIWALAFVQLRTDRPGASERFKDLIRTTPDIMFALAITGSADFALLVSAPTLAAYERFALSFQGEDTDVALLDSRVVLDRVKIGFSMPVEAASD